MSSPPGIAMQIARHVRAITSTGAYSCNRNLYIGQPSLSAAVRRGNAHTSEPIGRYSDSNPGGIVSRARAGRIVGARQVNERLFHVDRRELPISRKYLMRLGYMEHASASTKSFLLLANMTSGGNTLTTPAQRQIMSYGYAGIGKKAEGTNKPKAVTKDIKQM
ncbi:hypothetical protein CERZMDRAFT_89150 [Cercospora zeae-maydis SCOH1-5]|uniref:Uncharacterized protein n=1 Tax=Cercospora zeae-maydis SCOH1-5 TaxID=717836 RepID=A0A6A6F086_9PEZI|nr:hypothetical protein CERZMDRAFT_89150 [Cercospora zeae-maydis SCOH1-5]